MPDRLAVGIARQIIREIYEQHLPEGTLLGVEPELVVRYEVGRGVFREAVRILEQSGVVAMQRGPSGGLIVRAPDVGHLAESVAIFLLRRQATVSDLLEVREAFESFAVESLCSSLEPDGVVQLRNHITDPALIDDPMGRSDFHHILARLTPNRAVGLMCELMVALMEEYSGSRRHVDRDLPAQVAEVHERLVHEIISGNVGEASALLRTDVREMGPQVLPARESSLLTLESARPGSKRAASIARSILLKILALGWPVGANLGSQTDLMEEYEVSRAVLREAMRLLENSQIAYMRKGHHGGLIVDEPGHDSVVAAVINHLRFRRVSATELSELRVIVERLAVSKVIERSGSDLAPLSIDNSLDGAQALHISVGQRSGNPLLELLIAVQLELREDDGSVSLGSEPEDWQLAHDAIESAMAAGDSALARYLMSRHIKDMSRTARNGNQPQSELTVIRG